MCISDSHEMCEIRAGRALMHSPCETLAIFCWGSGSLIMLSVCYRVRTFSLLGLAA